MTATLERPALAPTWASPYDVYGVERPPTSFYDGTLGRRLVKCPDCRKPADELFRDHGGECMPGSVTYGAQRVSGALAIIRRAAMRHAEISANNLRDEFDAAGVPMSARGPAFGTAVRRGWLERVDSTPSLDGPTKGHRISVYRSLIHGKAAT